MTPNQVKICQVVLVLTIPGVRKMVWENSHTNLTIYVVLLTLLVPRAPNGRFGRPLKPSFLLFPSSSNTLKKTENIYLNRNCNQCNTLVVYYSLTILTSSKKIKT